MAIALYNKYRPQIFEDVVGQEQIARTLKNAIASNKTTHAYLFTGPRGTGKTTTARLFSKAFLCEGGPTPNPDGTCEDCELIANGEHPDVYELDAASRTGVENVREEIIGKVQYAPVRGRTKIYIIDEVHMLSQAAFNALLKTLEEPPDHVVFILCTTDPQSIPETILSRCQRFDFRRISSEEMISRLGAICEMEGVEFEGDALDLIAHRAQGGMRDALTSLEQLIAFSDGKITIEVAERLLGSLDSSELAEIVDAIGKRDAARCFKWTAEYMETGADLVQFVQDLTEHLRDMYVMSFAGADVPLEITESARRELEAELSMFGPDRLARALDVLNKLSMELKTSTNQRLSFEVSLTRLVRADSDLTLEGMAERIEELERALLSGVQVSNQLTSKAAKAASETEGASNKSVAASTETAASSAASSASNSQTSPSPSSSASHASSSDASGFAGKDVSGSLEKFWENVQIHLKKVGPAYAVIFMDTSVSLDGDTLVIEFGADKGFPFKAAQKQETRAALDKALAKAGKSNMAYKVVMSDKPHVSAASKVEDQPVDKTAAEPVVEAATSPVVEQVSAPVSELDFAKPAPAAAPASEPTPASAPADTAEPAPASAPADTAEPAPAVAPPDTAEPAPAQTDAEFADFLTSAFGENVVIEEIDE